jgi:hypothetical protein
MRSHAVTDNGPQKTLWTPETYKVRLRSMLLVLLIEQSVAQYTYFLGDEGPSSSRGRSNEITRALYDEMAIQAN